VTGAPILLASAANFDCELHRSLECDTHDVLIGYAVAVQTDERRMPLLYRNREYVGLT
jgi:flavin reductase (DIM6/NTAB) family NADH-FMN oxidoreductase RutF